MLKFKLAKFAHFFTTKNLLRITVEMSNVSHTKLLKDGEQKAFEKGDRRKVIFIALAPNEGIWLLIFLHANNLVYSSHLSLSIYFFFKCPKAKAANY